MAISEQHNRFQFNEYVSPIASEDLIKVALKKQEMYDEGRNKIKQVYDNYGQLRNTIINDNARNYFDQELSKVVKGIQANAGLDFANIGNVEAVINLGKPFENDKYIKNALENGAEAQRRYAVLEKMDKSQRNSDNDLVYLHDIMEYQKSGGLDTKLQKNKSYESYIDIRKKLEEAEKLVDAQEDYAIQKGNAPQGYFEQVTIKRKRAEDIYNRAMSFMNPDELRQLQIHAQADMYRLGSDAVYQTWVGHNKEQKLLSQDVIKNAKRQLGEYASIPPGKMTAEQIQTSNYLQKLIQSQEGVIEAAQQNIDMNPDDFDIGEYTGFFTKRFVEGFAKRFAIENRKVDLKEDVAWKLATQHSYELSRISAQEASTKRVENYKKSLDFVPESGADTTLISRLSGSIDFNSLTGTTMSAKLDDLRTKVVALTGLDANTKTSIERQIDNLKSIAELGTDPKNAYKIVRVGGNYVTSIGDFINNSNLAELLSQPTTYEAGLTPTAQETYSKEYAKLMGEINVYQNTGAAGGLYDQLIKAKKPSTQE